jgi:hypothetical protein
MLMEGLGQLKNPVTSSRIELAPFWLVAQCLNQLRDFVPPTEELNSYYCSHRKMLSIF